MKIKKLNFKKLNENRFHALSLFGRYSIECEGENIWVAKINKYLICESPYSLKVEYDSYETAMEAAQLDFEQKVKRCLDTKCTRIRQLKFEEVNENEFLVSFRPIDYLITLYSRGWILKLNKVPIDLNIDLDKKDYSESLEEAKQAAQLDFEKRIKECIEEE